MPKMVPIAPQRPVRPQIIRIPETTAPQTEEEEEEYVPPPPDDEEIPPPPPDYQPESQVV